MDCPACRAALADEDPACARCGAPRPHAEADAKPRFVPGSVDAYAAGTGPAAPPPPPPAAPQVAVPVPHAPGVVTLAPRRNAVALGSFVCGLLGLLPFWIGFGLCVVAILLGIAALVSGKGHGRGFAIAGIVLGIVFLIPAGCGF